jgi:ABC-type glycerol-3-phosphate transport system substrate-binding protein
VVAAVAPQVAVGHRPPQLISAKQGDIEVWHGKDVSGNFAKQIKAFNDSHPNGKVTDHELPDSADQQRQQMIQNTQIKNPKMAVLSVDVVWTAEFAAKGYVEALPADQFPTTGFIPATVDSATYFNKLYAYPATPTAACSTTAKTCSTSTAEAADIIRRDEGRLRQDPGRRERLQARLLRRSVQQVRGPDGELRRGGAWRGWRDRR